MSINYTCTHTPHSLWACKLLRLSVYIKRKKYLPACLIYPQLLIVAYSRIMVCMRDEQIITKYKSGIHAKQLGEEYGISDRQIQRIVKKAGVVRTQSESYILAIKQGRMRYHKKPEHLKFKRHSLSNKVRYAVLSQAKFRCALCGVGAGEGLRIEVDHIDQDATNNQLDNLQVLCSVCNSGKSSNWHHSATML